MGCVFADRHDISRWSYGFLHDPLFPLSPKQNISRSWLAVDGCVEVAELLVFGWKLAEGLPILQNRSCTNSHYRACGKILELPKCRRRQQLVGCTSWRGKPKFVLRREGVSSLAAQQESAKPAVLVGQLARCRVCCPAGGGREARARLPSFREIFWARDTFRTCPTDFDAQG